MRDILGAHLYILGSTGNPEHDLTATSFSDMSESSCLISLPLELIENIFSKLLEEEPQVGIPALKACCLTGKVLVDPAQRMLFRTFRVGSRVESLIPKDPTIGVGCAPSIDISPGNGYRVAYHDSTYKDQLDMSAIHIPYPSIRLASMLSTFPLHQIFFIRHIEIQQYGEPYASRPRSSAKLFERDRHVQKLIQDFFFSCLPNVRELTLKTPDEDLALLNTGQANRSGGGLSAPRFNPLRDMLLSETAAFSKITLLNLQILGPVDLDLLHGQYFPLLAYLKMKYIWFLRSRLMSWFEDKASGTLRNEHCDANSKLSISNRPLLHSLEFSSKNPLQTFGLDPSSGEQELRWFFHQFCPLDLSKLQLLNVVVYTLPLYECLVDWLENSASESLRTLQIDMRGGAVACFPLSFAAAI